MSDFDGLEEIVRKQKDLIEAFESCLREIVACDETAQFGLLDENVSMGYSTNRLSSALAKARELLGE
jgi:hypothetical protein